MFKYRLALLDCFHGLIFLYIGYLLYHTIFSLWCNILFPSGNSFTVPAVKYVGYFYSYDLISPPQWLVPRHLSESYILVQIIVGCRDGVNGYLLNYLSKPPLCILNPYRHSDGLVRSFSCQGLLEPNAIGNMGSRDVRDEWVEEVSSTALRGVRARCMCHVLLCVKINCAWRAWPERAGSVAYFHCAGVK